MDVSAAHCLRQTCVNDSYIISTILRRQEMQQLDELIEAFTSLIGDVGRADLGTPGDYETMVFPGSNDGGISDWSELDFRRYDTEDEAHAGHEELVTKWLEMPTGLGT